nr:MAG TPA: hypothetical protein [Bacteriophage sp.]
MPLKYIEIYRFMWRIDGVSTFILSSAKSLKYSNYHNFH